LCFVSRDVQTRSSYLTWDFIYTIPLH
jgi:hypothetical protein